MSTFDTMCDWREHEINDATAVYELLLNLEHACPMVKQHEAYVALCSVLGASLNIETTPMTYWDWIKA